MPSAWSGCLGRLADLGCRGFAHPPPPLLVGPVPTKSPYLLFRGDCRPWDWRAHSNTQFGPLPKPATSRAAGLGKKKSEGKKDGPILPAVRPQRGGIISAPPRRETLPVVSSTTSPTPESGRIDLLADASEIGIRVKNHRDAAAGEIELPRTIRL